MFVLDCATPCRFLGDSENESKRDDSEKTKVEDTLVNEEKPQEEEDKITNAPASWCSLCNVEMSQTKTTFRIEGWKGPRQKIANDGEELPVIVYLCPKCGKIDFRADEKLNKN